MLKSTIVAGQEVLLRSTDGRTWFQAPKDLLEYKRRRAKIYAELRVAWDKDLAIRDFELPDDTFPCAFKV